MDNFSNKLFIVTGIGGGESNLGIEVSRRLIELGAIVFGITRTERPNALPMYKVSQYHQIAIDLSSDNAHQDLLDLVGHVWPVSGIVHCAGKESIRSLSSGTIASFQQTMIQVSSMYSFLVAVAKNKPTLSTQVSMVVISSVASQRGVPNLIAYSGAKAAVEAMVRSAAIELAPHCRVNAITAGAFTSPMHNRITRMMGKETEAVYCGRHPLGYGTTEDVAESVIFLLDPEKSGWVTGTNMVVDGGYLARP
jgi:NAD(P)-dependent dehydrogenase (short-subunit alcohol dehydrogenase family)